MNTDIMRDKKYIRKDILELKKRLTSSERQAKSLSVMKKLEEHPDFLSSETVFIFWSMDDEVDTRDFIIKWADRKRFILPAINDGELFLKKFTGKQQLVAGDLYSIPEPAGKPFENFNEIDLIVIPGIAFDRKNNRLGRGKGYYDRILKRLKGKARLIGICYDFQIVDEVPVEPHDIKMDGVIYA